MIQLNLIPEVKNNYIKAQRKKRIVMLSAFTVSGVALGVVIIIASVVYGAQKVQLNLLDTNITNNTKKLQKISNLDKILTIQNQIKSLPSLHAQKPVASRLFIYLPQITPSDTQIANLEIDYVDSSMTITGTAKSLEAVNKFVDTIKFTKYVTDTNKDEANAFSGVVLSSFGISEKGASYTIKAKYDPIIFSSEAKTVTLQVPKITSTRSQTEQPGSVFNQAGN